MVHHLEGEERASLKSLVADDTIESEWPSLERDLLQFFSLYGFFAMVIETRTSAEISPIHDLLQIQFETLTNRYFQGNPKETSRWVKSVLFAVDDNSLEGCSPVEIEDLLRKTCAHEY